MSVIKGLSQKLPYKVGELLDENLQFVTRNVTTTSKYR
jgi:hypothetical protein